MRTDGTLRGGDDIVQAAHADHLVPVDRDVGAEIPVDLSGQQTGVDLEIETAVADFGCVQIGLGGGGARDRRDRVVVENIRRDRIVVVADYVQAAVEKSEVDTDIGLCGGFPAECGIGERTFVGCGDGRIAESIAAGRNRSDAGVVADVVIAAFAPACTQAD